MGCAVSSWFVEVLVLATAALFQPTPVIRLDPNEVREAVRRALAEDVGSGDVTTLACVPPEATARAVLRARESLVLAGLQFAETAFQELSPNLRLVRKAEDGQRLEPDQVVIEVSGQARAILTAERVALNFVQRLSGVATATARFVAAINGTHANILDTRKTTPGWRSFEKYAVACGGGTNHRLGLFDLVLIKDNHLAALTDAKPNPIAAAVRQARRAWPSLRVEVEADTVEQVEQAATAGADIILLDNMSVENLQRAVQLVAGRAQTEASGGVRLDRVRAIAETGVDFISVGAITHSAPAVDLGLDFLS
ncbi:MAG TPA: carboxylating nicotinate-nucleotide diphosphorylase [Verrucomicrobiales bacterium]|nr:carboxylating nicotinate-nucleotide diphosphorylase [Verrucomicrobiales bacterium]